MARKSTSRKTTSASRTSTTAARGRAAAKPAAQSGGRSARKTTKAAGKSRSGRAAAPRKAAAAGRRSGAAPSRSASRVPARRAGRSDPKRARAIFAEAVERALQGYLFDAIHLFEDAIAADPRGDLVDDALFNIGAAFLRMRLVTDAERVFTQVIEQHPDATIAAVAGGSEHGRTAAKALLGRMQARLAQGDVDAATADRDALRAFDGDSWAVDPAGRRRSFHELATAIMG